MLPDISELIGGTYYLHLGDSTKSVAWDICKIKVPSCLKTFLRKEKSHKFLWGKKSCLKGFFEETKVTLKASLRKE